MSYSDNIASFCQITGASIDDASAFMEMAAGDLSTAISLYFDNSGSANGTSITDMEESNDIIEEDDIEEVTEGEYNRILESQGFFLNILIMNRNLSSTAC